MSNMNVIVQVKSLLDFAYLWKKSSYNKPSRFFEDPTTSTQKRFQIYQNERLHDVSVGCLMFFRKGNEPL